MDELDATSGGYFIASLHYRVRLLELCWSFQDKLVEHQTQMRNTREVRKRISAAREPLDPLPAATKSKSARRRAEDDISDCDNADNTCRARLETR
jgi:hypothetical protein